MKVESETLERNNWNKAGEILKEKFKDDPIGEDIVVRFSFNWFPLGGLMTRCTWRADVDREFRTLDLVEMPPELLAMTLETNIVKIIKCVREKAIESIVKESTMPNKVLGMTVVLNTLIPEDTMLLHPGTFIKLKNGGMLRE
jgi:hypothetical protein